MRAVKVQMMPTKVPASTCQRSCCRSNIRLLPTSPEMMMLRLSHPIGLKKNMKLYANRAPMTPPAPAACMEIFHFMFIRVQVACINSDATKIPDI